MKKNYLKLICSFLFVIEGASYASAQNLVPNPGFEIQDSCPAVSEIFVAPPWNSPTFGTPDVMNSTCPSQNFPGRTGIGCAGIFAYSTFPDNREYIQAPLTATLAAGQMYYVSFWVKNIGDHYAVNKMGAYFSIGAVNNQSTTSNLPYTPQVQNPSSHMLSASGWMQITGAFTASGGETHIIIGNFSSDSQTTTGIFNGASSNNDAYYQIDDISVTATATGINDPDGLGDAMAAYPSPATDRVTLVTGTPAHIRSIQLFNEVGQLVQSPLPDANEVSEVVLNLESCSAGLYYVTLETEHSVLRKKIMVVK